MSTGRTDIHFHGLPGVDDGPADRDESLAMARAAAEDGTREVVVTPHVRRDFLTDVSSLPDQVRELQGGLTRAGVPLDLRCGGEMGHDMVWSLNQRDLETIAQGPPGARWLLVETPFEGLDEDVLAALDEIRERGFGIVLAHPERSAGLLGAAERALAAELALGTLLQVNVHSLAGGYGAEAEGTARGLLAAGLVHVLATDSHPGWRVPALSLGVERAVAAGAPRLAAEALAGSRPAGLLARGVTPRAPASAPAQRSMLREAPSSR